MQKKWKRIQPVSHTQSRIMDRFCMNGFRRMIEKQIKTG